MQSLLIVLLFLAFCLPNLLAILVFRKDNRGFATASPLFDFAR